MTDTEKAFLALISKLDLNGLQSTVRFIELLATDDFYKAYSAFKAQYGEGLPFSVLNEFMDEYERSCGTCLSRSAS